MVKTIDRLLSNIRRKAIIIVALLVFISFNSCSIESLDQNGSDGPPSFTQQILLNAIPASIFGNGCSFVDIEAIFNQLLTINGATIQAELNSSVLTINERGCITSVDPVVINGRAFIEYLGGPVRGTDFVGSVNVGVTVTLPNGVQQSNFVAVTILGVGILEPIIGPTMITANPAPVMGQPAPPPVFATIQVNTQGIVPGTFVDFEVFDPTCGFLTDATPVLGSTAQGVAVVQYNANDGAECTQTVIVTIVIADPSEKDSSCTPVPVGERTIQASITFEQMVGPTPSPTPIATPTPPTPTPTPTPPFIPTIDVVAFNPVIEPLGKTIITATTNTGSNTDVCCDIPIQSSPPSTLDSMVPDCGVTDINGDFFSVLTGGNVVTLQTIQVRCCIDSNTTTSACDPEEPQDSVFVDIDPAGVPPPITLVASPSTVPPGGTSTITASTTPPVPAGTEICFNVEIDSSPPSTLSAPCSAASAGGQAVVGLMAGAVPIQQTVTVRGCINQDPIGDDVCDPPTDPSNFVSVTIIPPPPPPPPTPTAPPMPAITITSGNLNPMAGTSTGINAFTNEPIFTNVCVKFIMNSIPASDLDGGATIDCGFTDANGDVLGLFMLNVNAGASGQQITINGCIDNMPNNSMCDLGEPLSNTLTFNVQ